MSTYFYMCHMRCIKSNWDFIMITQVKSSRWEPSFCGRNSPSQLYHNQLDYLKSQSDLICTQIYVAICVLIRNTKSIGTYNLNLFKSNLICQLSIQEHNFHIYQWVCYARSLCETMCYKLSLFHHLMDLKIHNASIGNAL